MYISFIFSLLDVVLNNPPDSEAMETQMAGVLESFRNNSLSIGKVFDGYRIFLNLIFLF